LLRYTHNISIDVLISRSGDPSTRSWADALSKNIRNRTVELNFGIIDRGIPFFESRLRICACFESVLLSGLSRTPFFDGIGHKPTSKPRYCFAREICGADQNEIGSGYHPSLASLRELVCVGR
jgi:hypothetical protein